MKIAFRLSHCFNRKVKLNLFDTWFYICKMMKSYLTTRKAWSNLQNTSSCTNVPNHLIIWTDLCASGPFCQAFAQVDNTVPTPLFHS